MLALPVMRMVSSCAIVGPFAALCFARGKHRPPEREKPAHARQHDHGPPRILVQRERAVRVEQPPGDKRRGDRQQDPPLGLRRRIIHCEGRSPFTSSETIVLPRNCRAAWDAGREEMRDGCPDEGGGLSDFACAKGRNDGRRSCLGQSRAYGTKRRAWVEMPLNTLDSQ